MASKTANRDDYPAVETTEDTTIESVEQSFESGTLRRVTVELRWFHGEQLEGENVGNIKDEITAVVEFSIPHGENVAALSGFYPQTNSTGERLYRDTLKSLRVVGKAGKVVLEHTPPEVTVRPPTETINNELTY